MTKQEFNRWLKLMGFTKVEAARRLGLGRNTVYRYSHGIYPVPTHVALACAAIARDIKPWPF